MRINRKIMMIKAHEFTKSICHYVKSNYHVTLGQVMRLLYMVKKNQYSYEQLKKDCYIFDKTRRNLDDERRHHYMNLARETVKMAEENSKELKRLAKGEWGKDYV